MSTVLAVLRKDLRLELRTFETLPAMALFSLSTFVIFHFGFNEAAIAGQLAAGVLTVTLLFAALLGAGRLFVAEREQGGFDAFLLAPVDRTAMLVAKVAALLAFLVVLEVIAVPAFALLLLGPSLAVSAVLFALGVAGVLLRRNAIVIFMCVELMLNAVNLTFVALAQQLGVAGQIFVFFVMAVAAAEAGVGLAIMLAIYRHRQTVNLQNINLLRG